jgi:hypothetical protein
MTSRTLRFLDCVLMPVITSLVFASNHAAGIEFFAEHLPLQS